MEPPIYSLIAGPNGAGKSTLYRVVSDIDREKLGTRVNYDEIFKHCGDELLAGRRCVEFIHECILEKQTFHQETTLAGRSIIKTIKDAKKNDFKVNLHYVGLDSYSKAIGRVRNRVLNDGHDVPINDIISRYNKSLELLPKVMILCDNIYIYDNSDQYRMIFSKKKMETPNIYGKLPKWISEIMVDYLWR